MNAKSDLSVEQTESTYRGILPHQGPQLHPSVMQSPTAGVQSGPQEAWGGCPGSQAGQEGIPNPLLPTLVCVWKSPYRKHLP